MGIDDFFNWQQIRTKLMWGAISLFLFGFGYAIYPVGWTMHQDIQNLHAYAEFHEEWSERAVEEVQANQNTLDRKLAKILDHIERDYYLSGIGAVGTFGGDESYIRVNRGSDAKIYKDGDRVRITCTSVEGKPDAILRVDGTFSNSNSDLLVSFSKQAADNLGLTGRTEVELEPILEE